MKPVPHVFAVLLAISACNHGAALNRPPDAHQLSVDERNAAWTRIIWRATEHPDYVGSQFEDDELYVGFSRNAAENLAGITNRPEVHPFVPPRSQAELEAHAQIAAQTLLELGFTRNAYLIDLVAGEIIVTNTGNAQVWGDPFCDQLLPLPTTIGPANVVLRDKRTCAETGSSQ
jgi:hypothetical protein